MFVFDEELFNIAADKADNAQKKMEDANEIINTINNTVVDDEFTNDISEIFNTSKIVHNAITELNTAIKRTKKIYEYTSAFSWLSKDLFSLLLLSPFSIFPGQFGGDQDNPLALYQQYILNPDELSDSDREKIEDIIKIFEKHNITDPNAIDHILYYVKTAACGYVVIANIVCDLYKDKPQEFEERYGYPLYYMNYGQVNYNFDALLVDIYLNANDDYIGDINYANNVISETLTAMSLSLTYDDMVGLVESLDLGLTGATAKRDISIRTYNNYITNGDYDYACIGVRRFTLTPFGNNDTTESIYVEGGHWMLIVGITDDNRYIVSSNGKEWILEPGCSPYQEKGNILYQPHNDNDGGLIFFRIGDNNE